MIKDKWTRRAYLLIGLLLALLVLSGVLLAVELNNAYDAGWQQGEAFIESLTTSRR
jgi:hypothetical protein